MSREIMASELLDVIRKFHVACRALEERVKKNASIEQVRE